MAFSAMLFVPIAVLLHPYLVREDTWYMPLATTFGVIAGVVQTLGFIRWTFLAPYLASSYLDPSAGESTRAAIEVTFSAFNQYAGVGVGEHLGYLFTAAWSLLIAISMLRATHFKGWVAWLGILSAVGILLGNLEPTGVPLVGLINAIAYIAWSVWLVIVGVCIMRVKA